MTSKLNYKITISGTKKHLEKTRQLVHFIATQHGMAEMDADSVEMAVAEACDNAILYGINQNQPANFHLELSINKKSLKAIIIDQGDAIDFDIIESFNIQQDFLTYKNGSLGIPLIKKLMDEVRYERKPDKSNELTLIKYFKRQDSKKKEIKMKIKEENQGDITILTLSGMMMNDPSVTKLHPYIKELIDKGCKQIVVDMGKVKWFYSTGLGAILASYTSLRNAGGDLRIARPNRKIYNVLMQTELIKIFQHFKTVEAAIESYKND